MTVFPWLKRLLSGVSLVSVLTLIVLVVALWFSIKASLVVTRHLIHHADDWRSWFLLLSSTTLWVATTLTGTLFERHAAPAWLNLLCFGLASVLTTFLLLRVHTARLLDPLERELRSQPPIPLRRPSRRDVEQDADDSSDLEAFEDVADAALPGEKEYPYV